MKQQPEYQLQKQVCAYLSIQYNEVLFISDTIASVRLTMPQAIRIRLYRKKGLNVLIY
jgi:hypothetical protein